MSFLLYILAIFIGVAIATQSAINNQLKSFLGGGALLASLVSFVLGSFFLFFICLFSGEKLSLLYQIRNVNPLFLLGGFLGALFVFGTTFLAPRLGVTAMISLVILGQVTMAMILDKFGLLGMPIREILTLRVFGVVFVLIGVVMVSFGGN
ncbi:DMT family transporter [Photorhabdus antumapuensis]|uniref:DMT family transporter n=1 Tax=Photorhabdus antumapuensis TaxID=2862867 RepID=UPI001CEC98CA|nr:DMT family transporter [Photorhabdus antumapuensis]MCA6220780.1 DMT family transporter [Photorhabdus antumapuensis]